MFTKILKYDFLFSRNAFLGMTGLLVGLSIVLRLSATVIESNSTFSITGATVIMAVFIVCSISLFNVMTFFRTNFFDDPGYLMLTLPVQRGKLIISKVVVSMAWFNFMLVVGVIASYILFFTADSRISDFFNIINMSTFMTLFEINIFAVFFVTVLFMAITLANSVFGRWQVFGVAAWVAALGYAFLCFWLNTILSRRFIELVDFPLLREAPGAANMSFMSSHGLFSQPLLGLRYGRIPIGDVGLYVDVYRWGTTLGLAAIAIAVTYLLLKRFACLR